MAESEQSPFSILIVDDMPANLTLLSRMLQKHGYRARPAPSGVLALQAAKHERPDLILMDIHMPGMDGFEVCRRLKADPELADIPVLFISALSEVEDKVRAFDQGGQDYITKPFQIEEVLARVRTHLELQRARQEVEARNQALAEALEQLKKTQNQMIMSEKMAALGVLAAGVAHEINNPINFVKASCHSLERDVHDLAAVLSSCQNGLDQDRLTALEAFKTALEFETTTREIPELFARIFEGLRRTEEIVKSLRGFARTDDAMDNKVDPRDVIDAVLIMLRPRYKRLIQVDTVYGETPAVRGNAGKLSQVLINILSNAIDAVEAHVEPADRRITVSTGHCLRDGTEHAVIQISDTGAGVPLDIRNRIFDPFFTTKPVGKGTGLGLFICNNLILEHNGAIDVSGPPGQGATFSIFLPAYREDP